MFSYFGLLFISLASLSAQEPIRHGEQVLDVEEYPYVVHIKTKEITKAGEEIVSTCTGVILNREMVLSAAHCFQHDGNKLESIQVKAGIIDLDTEVNEIQVKGIRIHENYAKMKRKVPFGVQYQPDDVVVLWLSESLEFSTRVAIAPLAERKENVDGSTVTAVGWGRNEHGYISRTLKKAKLHGTLRCQCKMAYYDYHLSGSVFCAQSTDKESTISPGDSGGPLIFQDLVIGLLSFGRTIQKKRYDGRVVEIGHPWEPAVYTKVYKYRKWIEKSIEQGLPTVKCTGYEKYCLLL